MGECLPYGLSQLGLVHAELADRAAHAHPRAHELGLRVDPEPDPDRLAGLSRNVCEAVDLVQGFDVDGEDALVDGALELVVGLARAGENDVLGLEAGGPRHSEFPGGGDLGPGLLLRGDKLANAEARVRLYGVGDLCSEDFVDAADPIRDHLPVVKVEGSPVVFGYSANGNARGSELAAQFPAEALGQVFRFISLSKHCLSPCGRSCLKPSWAAVLNEYLSGHHVGRPV